MVNKEIMIGTWVAISLMLGAAVGVSLAFEAMTAPFTPKIERSSADWWMKQ